MKKQFVALMFAFTVSVMAYAQKQYTVGEEVLVDGIKAFVVAVDPSGSKAKVMSLPGLDPAQAHASMEEVRRQVESNPNLTAEQRQMALDMAQSTTRESFIQKIKEEKGKKGTIFKVDTWAETLPQGWRLPNASDAADICSLIFGGLGDKHSIKLMDVINNAKKVTPDMVWNATLMALMSNGFICGENHDPANVKFVNRQKKGLKCYMTLQDKFIGNESTIAVKDLGEAENPSSTDSNAE